MNSSIQFIVCSSNVRVIHTYVSLLGIHYEVVRATRIHTMTNKKTIGNMKEHKATICNHVNTNKPTDEAIHVAID